ncbi:MAG TPA: PepSY domain-containing protein [Candidatus Corynebacterium avicola]|uniref:PepSY domain-containing protein n=1 Tax=Candidatus Corynebacterium avicola TaxID=2838527 RepID=A0A9D1UMH2_9CORY|nr:PepSY domain-containing protein [Candidatus Corynebacterium avicola]
MTTTTEHPSPTAPTAPSERTGQQLPRLLKRLHFFAGVLCAPLILVAAVTGFLYAVSPTVERVVHHDLLTATAHDAPAVPVSEQVTAARAEFPDLPLAGVRLGEDHETTRVLFADVELPESTTRAVFVDPYSGEVKGDSTQYGSSAALPMRHWLSQGHRMLWLGEPGRLYSELAASWLGVLAVGGLVMWWQRHRKNPGRMLGTGGRGRTRTMRRHGATGTVVAVGMVFLTATGLTWSSVAGTNIGQVRSELSWQEPAVSTSIPGVEVTSGEDASAGAHASHGDHGAANASGGFVRGLNPGAVDRVAATAREELRTPVTLTPPAADGEAWTAKENRASYRLTTDAVSIDWATGQVTDRIDFRDWPLAAQASSWLIQLHMGTLFGLPNQLVLAVLAAAIAVMVVWGYAMWFRRRGRDQVVASAPPRAPTDGGWSAGAVVLVVALAAYGLVAPLFGVTCLAFVVFSSLWSRWRERSS